MAYVPKQIQGSSVGGFTAGSVPFAGADGTLTEDNDGLFFDSASDFLGVGTASPTAPVHVSVNAPLANGTYLADIFGAGSPGIVGRRALGTKSSPAQVTANQTLLGLSARGHTGSAFTGTIGTIQILSSETITASAMGTHLDVNLTRLGTTTLSQVVRLSHDNVTAIVDLSISEATNIKAGTMTGLKIGTAATQKLGFWDAAPVIQQVGGVTLVNNVTAGGTTNTVDNVVAAGVDTTAASLVSTRNAMHQVARKLKLITDALRTEGLLQNADA